MQKVKYDQLQQVGGGLVLVPAIGLAATAAIGLVSFGFALGVVLPLCALRTIYDSSQ